MNIVSLVIAIGSALAGLSSVSGTVMDEAGAPISGARVFAEPGLGGALLTVEAASDGTFLIGDVPAGGTGVFAVADGYAFGGEHVQTAVDDAVAGLKIRLARPDTVSGKIVDVKGHPVEGARVTRAGLLGASKVGIPLAKLKSFGFQEPVSDAEGRFTLIAMPKGGSVALKVGHPQFAQEGVDNVNVGDQGVKVTLYPGVLVRGSVRSRDASLPVVDAEILFRNAYPPNDTAMTTTDHAGEFVLRLKPGKYLYQAAGVAYRTPGWRELAVTGDSPVQPVELTVAGVGTVAGKIGDAVSGKPVSGARVVIEANGSISSVVRTGANGTFEAAATEGENVVRIESVPGYRPPELKALRVQVREGERADLPEFWLAPLPTYTVQVVDEDMVPAPGVVVSVLRPAQFGWRVTGPEGRVPLHFATLPADGVIVGMAEHPKEPLGAIFALHAENIGEAKVQLLQLGSVHGQAISTETRGIEGATIGAVFTEDLVPEPLWLWRTLAGGDGAFEWPAIVPLVPQQCRAVAGVNTSGESMPFNLEPGGSKDLGGIVVANGVRGASMKGRSLEWHENPVLAGQVPEKKERKNRPAWVMYCNADEAGVLLEGIAEAQRVLGCAELLCALVVKGSYTPEGLPQIPILAGQAPASATTYLIGRDGKVTLETFGMPPLRALQTLLAASVEDS
ncbi:MAG: Carboxypeptidase regulatory-like protein [Candidatus Hydrogenedentes bacterium]|nr:Carboxypeptidase regulatory-like protein [Candidatus Hydrogenedentota bacterium]